MAQLRSHVSLLLLVWIIIDNTYIGNTIAHTLACNRVSIGSSSVLAPNRPDFMSLSSGTLVDRIRPCCQLRQASLIHTQQIRTLLAIRFKRPFTRMYSHDLPFGHRNTGVDKSQLLDPINNHFQLLCSAHIFSELQSPRQACQALLLNLIFERFRFDRCNFEH